MLGETVANHVLVGLDNQATVAARTLMRLRISSECLGRGGA